MILIFVLKYFSANQSFLAIAQIKKTKLYDYKFSGQDPHIFAAIMKQWLRELPIPLFQVFVWC
jgi:hypothetical protein